MLLIEVPAGLLAWAFPILGMKKIIKSPAAAVFLSMVSGAVCVLAVLKDIEMRAVGGDYPGILDTIGADIFGVAVMSTVAILLDTALVFQISKKI